ncbi:hypothetical protein M408DRAFT_22024 [Serendipita vermifera MAFF 305830]|uniref:Conserved oligomeric Golgi complex subunit 2 n=1 Tax=Serendipita vermifera MAFF 305830 TaxID=933852 RepID=A0A0C3BEH5_SERVB|nr:hypothetical protein M408DRAFT_22024 [Serendipita vermifera MAFF 305830]
MDLSPRQTLDSLTRDLAQREGDLADDNDYQLPVLEPLSHDHALLSATTPDFDVEAFLLSRSHTSLTDLRVELRDYLALLKDELVQLINDDYEAFISLSTDLRGEGERLERIKAPFGDMRTEIQKSGAELREVEAAVQAKLDERARLREEKILLRLLFNISDSLTRLESLLLIPPPEDAQQSGTPRRPNLTEEDYDQRTRTGRAKHLARVATEFVQLLYQAEKAGEQDCVYVSENQWRIDRIKETISRDLDQLFGNAISSLVNGSEISVQERARLISDVSECFKSYDVLGIREEAEEILRAKIMRPFVNRVIFTGALNVPHTPVMPRTPFIPSSGALVPNTPFTPFTGFPGKQGATSQSYFFLQENSRLPLLDDSDNQLATLYNTILQFVERNCVEIMEIAERVARKHGKKAILLPNSGNESPVADAPPAATTHAGFDIMASVVWAEIGRALMDELGAMIFAAGKPAEFRSNYATTRAFISGLEYLAPDLQAVKSMRAHPVYATFERRWQLPVYFQLRWREVVVDLEAALGETRYRPSLDYDASGCSAQASAVMSSIARCWSSDVFIAELGHRFWKLTLQILGRYKNWLKENMPMPEATQTIASLREEKANLGRATTPPPRNSTPQQEGGDVVSTADEEKLRQLATMMTDIKIIGQKVLLLWHEDISPRCQHPDEASLEGILRDSLRQIEAIIPDITLQVVAILTRKCSAPVENVRQLPNQIRALSRRMAPSSAASPFVGEIFKPLRDFFGLSSSASVVVGGLGAPPSSAYRGVGRPLQADYGKAWATDILEIVSSKYIFHLEYMRKNEEALRRLKKGARTGFSLFGSSGTSTQDDASKDEERVRAQMILDVERLGKEAETFGVDVDSVPAYVSLVSLAAQSDGG